MAVRINLSVDEVLFKPLKEDADQHNCPVNVHVISILEKIYMQNPFDYETALKVLEKEAKEKPVGEEFILADLPSFSEICIARADDAKLKPSEVRARLGKMFNARVREKKVGDVERSRDDNGELVFISRAAVYRRKPANREEETCYDEKRSR